MEFPISVLVEEGLNSLLFCGQFPIMEVRILMNRIDVEDKRPVGTLYYLWDAVQFAKEFRHYKFDVIKMFVVGVIHVSKSFRSQDATF
jgi:hypothetical protein